MEKIKILFEGLSSNQGGIETFIYSLYKGIDKNIYEISFLVDKNVKIAFQEIYENEGCNFFEITNRKDSYIKYLKDLKEVYKKNSFDIIHINIMSYSLFERITYACRYSNAKVIVHSHNGGFTRDCVYKKTMILDKMGRIFVKKYQKEFLKIACGKKAGEFAFKNKKFQIYNNGIDIERFMFSDKDRAETRLELGVDDDVTVIGLIAMFNNPKNHDFLLDIFSEYLKLNKNSKLMLIGDGYLKENIIEKAKKINLYENILFLGRRNDVEKLYSAMDIYIMPSLYEGLSISLCEAQVNGLKCYTSDRVDMESNISGNVEFISLQKTPKEWAETIYNNSNDRDTDVIHKIPDEFNSKKSYEKIYKFYENIVKN